uniref:Uncharacterized protein n=1 Tax=Anopheles arabiensis TaxID=7173 RepID=A0A182ICZ1_ANOAR
MSSIREYKFFRSFSAKIENWHIRKAESLWKKMRERKIAASTGLAVKLRIQAALTPHRANGTATTTIMHRRMSSIREYKFFRSFSAKIENWHIRKAESLWKKMRERKIA